MKQSKYNLLIETDQTSVIMFNTLYGSISLFTPEEYSQVKGGIGNIEKDSLLKRHLIEQKFIVDDTVNELEIVKNRKVMGVNDPNKLELIVIPTLACNFACTYCYENNYKSIMERRTVEALKKWLTTNLKNYKFLVLHWFGGEPLLAFKLIKEITSFINSINKSNDTIFHPHITTNGYLLTNKKVHDLTNIGICDYQVTLDGPPQIHDSSRMLKGNKPTYKIIHKNICNALQFSPDIKISLRINYNSKTVDSIPELLTSFPSIIRSQLRVVFEPIFCNNGRKDTANNSEVISQKLIDLYNFASGEGYDTSIISKTLLSPRLIYCYAERENQFIINYNGDVFKCSVCNFESKDRVGYLKEDGKIVKNANWGNWVNTNLWEEQCDDCIYLPVCAGGCRNERLNFQGTGSNCSVVPTNTHFLLKQFAYGNIDNLLHTFVENNGGDKT